MKLIHSMIRVKDLDRSLNFYCNLLGMKEVRRSEYPEGKFTLVYLNDAQTEHEIELTYNWGQTEEYSDGKNFGHFAFLVDDIYKECEKLEAAGVDILRPPRDGYMAFVKCPDGISIEFLQKGEALAAKEPWASRENQGSW